MSFCRISFILSFCLALLFASPLLGQDPTASLEGEVIDETGGAIPGATVKITHLATGSNHFQTTGENGAFSFPVLPVGEYELQVDALNFAKYNRPPIALSVNQRFRITVEMQLEATSQSVVVEATLPQVDTSSNVLGKVVGEQEILNLPLNGRNFAQLGLLQLGVMPLTAGVATHGGSRRSGQAYAVNGQRPESNNYLVDGAKVVNRVDGGFAFKLPVDAIAEFKILTHTAVPEYGGTSGANTSIVTQSGGNELHGTLYEFFRNDVFDARNFFSAETEPLKQNQFGGTVGGPVRVNKAFFFGYYEGFRNRQGITRGSTVPTPKQREGDFSELPIPLVDARTGQAFPNNQIPDSMIDPVSRRLLQYYPLGNLSPSFASATRMLSNNTDQGGAKLDLSLSSEDTASVRYSLSKSTNVVPFSILGADTPDFPVGDFLTTQLLSLAETHSFSGMTVNSFRTSFFRHRFLMEKRLSGLSPRMLGFNFDSTLKAAEGAPFFLVSGYSSFGDPTIGPRDTVQNNFEFSDALAHTTGTHTL
jgi:hypothetical protein